MIHHSFILSFCFSSFVRHLNLTLSSMLICVCPRIYSSILDLPRRSQCIVSLQLLNRINVSDVIPSVLPHSIPHVGISQSHVLKKRAVPSFSKPCSLSTCFSFYLPFWRSSTSTQRLIAALNQSPPSNGLSQSRATSSFSVSVGERER